MSTVGTLCKQVQTRGVLLIVSLVGASLLVAACASGSSPPTGGVGSLEVTQSMPSAEAPLATPAPTVPVTAMPLPPPQRPIYILDPNDGERISRILVIDPDQQRRAGSFSTRYLPDITLTPDGLRLYIADTYWSQVTRGEAQDVLSVYDTLDRKLVVDDLPVPGRSRYKVYPLGETHLFLSDDGSRLFLMKYGDQDVHQLRLVILDPENLEVLHEGPWPPCGRRVQVLADRWICANVVFPAETPAGPDFPLSLSLDAVDPWTGQKLETLLRVEDLRGRVAGLASSVSSERLYVIDRGMSISVVDLSEARVLERARLEISDGWQLNMAAVALSPEGRHLLIGVSTGEDRHRALTSQIWVYDTATWERVATVRLRDPAMHFAFSLAGDQLYVISPVGQSLTIYDGDTYDEVAILPDLGGSPARVIVPEGSR